MRYPCAYGPLLKKSLSDMRNDQNARVSIGHQYQRFSHLTPCKMNQADERKRNERKCMYLYRRIYSLGAVVLDEAEESRSVLRFPCFASLIFSTAQRGSRPDFAVLCTDEVELAVVPFIVVWFTVRCARFSRTSCITLASSAA
jgi:hypothetical protein